MTRFGQRQANDWQLLDGTGTGVIRLWAVADGTFVAADPDLHLYTSADNGDSWVSVTLPADGWGLAPDPTTSSTLYAAAPSGLYRSDDAGTTWTLMRPSPHPITRINTSTRYLAVSPADPTVVYLVEPLGGSPLSIWRSTDGAATWTRSLTISQAGSPCQTVVDVLSPHPSDPARLFSDAGCYAGRNFGHMLSQSTDGGLTWSVVFRDGQSQYPAAPIGGGPGNPSRWYMSTTPFQGIGPARLQRSDDDASTWTDVLEPGDSSTSSFGGVAIDPSAPDTVFVATGHTAAPTDTGVRVSYDGGQTWDFLGSQDIGFVNELVRGADGTLLAATNEGIWRLLPDQ